MMLLKKLSATKKTITAILASSLLLCMLIAPAQQVQAADNQTDISSLIEPVSMEEQQIVDENGQFVLGEGPEIIVSSKNKTNWNAPLKFVADGILTADNQMDMYFFTTTSAKAPMIKIESTNKNYVAQLYQYNAQTNEAIPIQFGDFSSDSGYAYSPSLPAYSFIWVVYSNGTVGDSYTIMANVTNAANPSYRGYVSPNLAETTFIYPNNVIMINNRQVSLPYAVEWKREFDVPVSDGYIHEEQTLSGITSACIVGKVYGSYSSTSCSTNNAVFYELKCPASLPPLNDNPLYSYLYSSQIPDYVNGGYDYFTNREDVTGLDTPRRISIVDTTDYRYWLNGNSYFALVYDLDTGKFIDFASRLNGYYFIEDSDNAEDIYSIRYEYLFD